MDSIPTEPTSSGAWMRFREEHRREETDRLIAKRFTKAPGFEEAAEAPAEETPAFELVTTYMHPEELKDSDVGKQSSTSSPYRVLHLHSPALTNALRSVVRYYPSQDLSGHIEIAWPYAILVHHYDELADFGARVALKDEKDLCEREVGAVEHIELLLRFLDHTVMSEVRRETDRNAKGTWTFANGWVYLEPGATFLMRMRGVEENLPFVVHSVSGGVFDEPPTSWDIRIWTLQYSGMLLGRVKGTILTDKFDGETPLKMKKVSDLDFNDLDSRDLSPDILDQINYGRAYWELLHGQCKYHRGKTESFPNNQVNGLVMVDARTYYLNEPSARFPKLMSSDDDVRSWASECSCRVCKNPGNKTVSTTRIAGLFDGYNLISPQESTQKLTKHQYFLCDYQIKAFVFQTRTWETVHVKNLSEPLFDEAPIDHLIMDPKRKNTLMSLSKSFARINQNDKPLLREPWAADFVAGKGHGLIFLLHGRPGVGKTCTAECIASFTKRPLMVLTPSDIGTDPKDVEANLVKTFKTAKSWNAVLLIDEADVFMERRSTADLARNSLVASFLRALEFYDGILFLTTNRVGSFDDAFISRVHVKLYYPDFDDEQRRKIWQTFVDKLARERGDYMRLNIDAKEYIRGKEIQALKWNGREIRNAFQTAVSLAEYDSERGEDGKIIVTDDHLRSVIDLSRDFKGYLNELHQADEAKRAERHLERLDTYQV